MKSREKLQEICSRRRVELKLVGESEEKRELLIWMFRSKRNLKPGDVSVKRGGH